MHVKELEYFQRKENSSIIKNKRECYNYNIIRYLTRECRKSKKSQAFITTQKE